MLKRLTIMSLAAIAMAVPVHAQELKSMSWDQIVAQAKKEGEITWFHWYFQDRFREQVKAFEAETGIKVKIPDGSNDSNFNKMLAEKDRAEGDIDVLSLTGADVKKLNVAQYLFGPVRQMLPEGAKLNFTIDGGDSQGYAPAFWGNQMCIAYNPDRIAEADLPRTLEQFASFLEKNPGELGFNAASSGGGSGPGFIEGVTRKLVPDVDYASGIADAATLKKLGPAWDWFKSHKDQFVVTASNADSVARLTSGEFMMVATFEDLLSGLQKKGEVPKTFKVYVPDFGMPSGGNMVSIPANAKHKAAALVFVNWLTSAKTQTKLSRDFGSAPQHPEADTSESLVSDGDRGKGFTRSTKPLRDDISKQFSLNVLQQ
ncbi:extracellular solute-binding protein [Ensifer sp. ENS02]|uniref:extracellular solute-binding protein n=1 Tax=Ensifer sp. ENS02 TaxID=2769290 RepID=UPI00177DD1A9|nr:extracellular solute-binding protein [Ensifer sp. ENS02]MBD9525099.1 extracellular solute-binding protein [Ensifer sp. ENS02]